MAWDQIITKKQVTKIWRTLNDSEVPVVASEDFSKIDQYVEDLIYSISSRDYMPSVGHGYLGSPKGVGCTRYIPILSKTDMAVFYISVLYIHRHLLTKREGIFGAWRIVPQKIKDDTQETSEIYFSNNLSKNLWFKNWKNFNEVLTEFSKNKPIGNYVGCGLN